VAGRRIVGVDKLGVQVELRSLHRKLLLFNRLGVDFQVVLGPSSVVPYMEVVVAGCFYDLFGFDPVQSGLW
jgi:hypothetical protein